jgi:AraC-like DNA-binding protein/mannose-6-phosphate isomerase-like protein (cupin superfamily)
MALTVVKPPDKQAWAMVDPLGEALHFLRMSGIFYSRAEFTAPWGLEMPAMEDCLMFHFVTSGRCWLEVGEEGRWLQPGDLALVPHGRGHVLRGEPGAPAAKLFDLPRELVSERYELLNHGGGGTPATSMICGAVKFDHPAAHQLIMLLPAMICIEAFNTPDTNWIQSTLRLMAAEAKELKPGGETVITRLADILVIQTIRSWMAQDPAAQTGWLRALQDKQIGRAITLVHRNPGKEWSVASLANEVAMSRSAFAARFTELVGEPAMKYVVRWRMHLAARSLKEERAPVSELAERLGYESEAAFSRAFKRVIGTAPGALRRPRPIG